MDFAKKSHLQKFFKDFFSKKLFLFLFLFFHEKGGAPIWGGDECKKYGEILNSFLHDFVVFWILCQSKTLIQIVSGPNTLNPANP